MDLPLSHFCWCRSALLKLHNWPQVISKRERWKYDQILFNFSENENFSKSYTVRSPLFFKGFFFSAKNPENVNLNFVWRLSAPVLELTDLPCFSGEEASNWRLEEPFKIIIKGFWSLLFTMFVPFSQEIPKKLKSFRQNIRLFFWGRWEMDLIVFTHYCKIPLLVKNINETSENRQFEFWR